MKEVIGTGKIVTNASALFATVVSNIEADKALKEISEEGPTHPTDSHPSLSVRLNNLGVKLEDVTPAVAHTAPEPGALSLVAAAEPLEKELSEIEQAIMIKTGEASPGDEVAESASAS